MNAPETMTHEQAIELLPWLVNDSLPETDRAAMLAHTRFCMSCRSELDSLEKLQRVVADDMHAQPVPAPDMRRINRRIDELIGRPSVGQRLDAAWQGLSANLWRTAFVAQAVVLLGLVAVWMGRELPDTQRYTTLTQSQALPAGEYVRAVFSPALDEAGIERFAGELGLSVWNGPSPRGVYTLVLMPEADREAVMTALRGSADVLFAEPIHSRAPE